MLIQENFRKKSHREYLVNAFPTTECGPSTGQDEEADLEGSLNKMIGQPNG